MADGVRTRGTFELSRTDVDFIILSSVVGLVGNPSQAAYADFPNQLGQPAVSLDLGRVVGVGFVAEKRRPRVA
ncbi:hypothetical protein V1517DRAFT_328545 [Lipomyces orientalis]|uniref:Uncharacterized protein n=1 Tax=Lipomyces orientalis TaxID=1233043 RepID=A0ACC3THR1_9ASCO